jgi:hypothetical protein
VDGSHFRIWVSDNKRSAPIELESRSQGLQWFFWFYLTFLVESEDQHKDAILLLDEPGHQSDADEVKVPKGKIMRTSSVWWLQGGTVSVIETFLRPGDKTTFVTYEARLHEEIQKRNY